MQGCIKYHFLSFCMTQLGIEPRSPEPSQQVCSLVLFDPYLRPYQVVNTLGQNEPGSDSKEGVLRISQRSSMTGALPSDCLVSYPGHSLGESYLSVEMPLVYSTPPTDLTTE